jgi:hypothetical protein
MSEPDERTDLMILCVQKMMDHMANAEMFYAEGQSEDIDIEVKMATMYATVLRGVTG